MALLERTTVPASGIPLKILICDCDKQAATLLYQTLKSEEGILEVQIADSIAAANRYIEHGSFNAIFIDPLSLWP